ncbi:DUF3068 domain-containing protein [Kribbella sp. CA-293567]|uniref:DUF3068 domain-containing protein n=1 Tax=Kribbella sp. CA-293567 TaxID=3002436 RepID=UPI0022DD4EFF|nr:DUF3068 domain-containing protein [Kribbella sp. CA-293567]WBQ02378.1 DUF3068 domain-containing protein [Kribbella sp. CA-293567]
MGNRSRVLVIALGIFFVGIAALAKFYAYPTLAVAPADQVAHTVSTGPNATFFSAKELAKKENQTLEARRTVRGDVKAAEDISKKLGRDVVVFDTAVVTANEPNYQFPDDPSDTDNMPLSFVQERVVLDAHTGEAVRWDDKETGEYITTTLNKADRQTLDNGGSDFFRGHEGLVLKFPFGTEKKEYKFWDTTTRKAFPVKFEAEDELYGLKVYKFVQEVPKQKLLQATQLQVPGKLVGEPAQAAVAVDRTYQNTRTLWIEPVTGAIIKGEEKQLASLEVDDEPRLTATEVTIAYDDATVKKNVEGAEENGVQEGGYQAKAAQLNLIGFWVPLLSLIIGLLLLGLVVALQLRTRPVVATRAKSKESS